MKFLNSFTLLTLLLASTLSIASAHYGILTCGDVIIYSEYQAYPACSKHKVGPLKGNSDWNLGKVYTSIRHSNMKVAFNKVGQADRSFFGGPKGFGLYENDNFILDLRNTADLQSPYDMYYKIHK